MVFGWAVQTSALVLRLRQLSRWLSDARLVAVLANPIEDEALRRKRQVATVTLPDRISRSDRAAQVV